MNYSAQLLKYFYHRPHAGHLDTKFSVQVGHAENHEVLVLFVDYQERIVTARFKAAGSAALIAGGEWVCEWLERKAWQELSQLTPEWILIELQLPQQNIHIAHLIVMAVRQLQDIITRELGTYQ